MIRLLVVEDSNTVRQVLVAAFEADPEIQVVGTAASGEEALEAVRRLAPDVVTMDFNMPGMNGLEATRAIMSTLPLPIVIITGKMDPHDADTLFRAMEAGALMVLAKPEPVGTPGHAPSVARIVQHVKLMSEIKVVRRTPQRVPVPAPPLAGSLPADAGPLKVVAIGASTGGPPLVQQILAGLPADCGAAILVVQHMAEGFVGDFARWLNQNSRLPVQVAAQGMQILPGRVYLAPDGHHLEVGAGEMVALTTAPPLNGVRPSAGMLFRSVALRYGARAAGVILTGMGSDGAVDLKLIRDKGGVTVAQNRESCVVFGMPGKAVELDAAGFVLPPEEIVELLAALVRPRAGAEPR